MKFTFNEKPDRDDFGGTLTIAATTPDEVCHLAKHFRIFDTDSNAEDALALAAAIGERRLEHTIGTDKRPAYEIHGCLGPKWSEPYIDEVKRRTGWHLPASLTMDLTPHYKWGGLCHTHYLERIWIEDGCFCYKAYVTSGDWNGKTAGERAAPYADESVRGVIGYDATYEKRLIVIGHDGRGNPIHSEQSVRVPPKPGIGCKEIFAAILDHWLAEHANGAQRAWVEADKKVHEHIRCGSDFYKCGQFGGWISPECFLRKDWEKGYISIEKFISLKPDEMP